MFQINFFFSFTVYEMSSETERLTQNRKITVKKYSENKCVNKRGANDLYVIWVKMSDLQKT